MQITLIAHSAKNDNLGVGALTVSDIEIVRSVARQRGIDCRIVVVDGRDPRPSYVVEGPDVEVREMRPIRSPWSFFQVVRASDIVIDIGGGDSFADIYGASRFFKMHLMKYLTHLGRRPLVLAPQTIGPFKSPVRRWIAAQSIRLSAVVATRDSMSTRAVREMGIGSEVIEASDVALRLPWDRPERAADGSVSIGINVSGLLMNGGYTRNNMFGLQMNYAELMREILRRFIAHPDGCKVHLVPHVISWEPGALEDDYQPSLDLAAEFPGVTVAPRFTTPSEAKSYIAGMDFFMGARMHSCIAAFSTGVPVVPMAYSRKFAGLFGGLGYNQTVDCTTESAETILDRIFAAYERRAELSDEVRNAFALGLRKLGAYEAALGDLMERLAAKSAA